MTARCPWCNAPAVIRHDRVHLAHLSWCRTQPRPRPPAPLPPPPPITEQQAFDNAAATYARLAPRIRAAEQARATAARAAHEAMRARLHEIGATHADVREWAVAAGHLHYAHRGITPRDVIELYADEHQP